MLAVGMSTIGDRGRHLAGNGAEPVEVCFQPVAVPSLFARIHRRSVILPRLREVLPDLVLLGHQGMKLIQGIRRIGGCQANGGEAADFRPRPRSWRRDR